MEALPSLVSLEGQLFAIVAVVLICQVLYLIIYAIRPKGEKAVAGAIKLINMLHAILVGPAAALVILRSPTMAPARQAFVGMFSMDREAVATAMRDSVDYQLLPLIVSISVGFLIWDLLHFFQWDKPDYAMVLHHVGSILLWPPAVYTPVQHFYVIFFISTELSSPFLQARWFIRNNRGDKSKTLMLVNFCFALMFFLARTIWIPSGLYGYYCIVTSPKGFNLIPYWKAVSSAISIPIPFILNGIWSLEIMRMIGKALRPKKSKAPKTE
eukprot:g47713.t1